MRHFKKTYIEITNICNLSCSFCPKTVREGRFMDRDLFVRILSEIKGYTKYLYFHVLGEPLLHPEIGTFLDISDSFGFKVNITTNGTLIDSVSDILLKKPALRQVNFSLHSFEANTCSNTMEYYLNEVFEFIREAKKVDLLICLRLWNLNSGIQNKNNQIILEEIQHEFKLPYKIEEQLTPCKGIKIGENIFLNQASTFEWPDVNREEYTDDKAFCYGLRDQVGFLADGTVIPCCLDNEGTVNLGNIKEMSFVEIIEGQRAKDMFEGFSQRKAVELLCKKCGYRKRFNI